MPEGALGWVRDKVTVTENGDTQKLIESLLEGTVLVSDLETALRIANNLKSEIRNLKFVTLAGEVLTANGIVHGGATSEAVNSVLQRKNQIHELEREEAVIVEQVASLNRHRNDLALEIETTQARLDEAREEKQNATLQVSTMRNQLAMIEREAKETERKQQNLEGERASSEARH